MISSPLTLTATCVVFLSSAPFPQPAINRVIASKGSMMCRLWNFTKGTPKLSGRRIGQATDPRATPDFSALGAALGGPYYGGISKAESTIKTVTRRCSRGQD